MRTAFPAEKRCFAPALPQSRALRLVLQDGKLLPKGEVLGGRLGAIAEEGSDEQHVSTQHGHFTPFRTANAGPESVAGPSNGASHKSFAGKGYGILGMHGYRELNTPGVSQCNACRLSAGPCGVGMISSNGGLGAEVLDEDEH